MRPGRPRAARGFAYVLLLVAVAGLTVAATAALQAGAAIARRDAESQLLAIGAEFEAALRSYAGVQAMVPGAAAVQAAGPRSLDDLLKDPRVPGIRRHLRQVYADPLTGRPLWGLFRNPAGEIVGIHSMAEGRPVKRSGFPPHWARFEDARDYRDWVFGPR